jgi:deoxyribodipyrimidine photo-lyase
MAKKNLFWFRKDLRLSDNPALHEASQNGEVMAIYILDEEIPGSFKMGGATKWWLHNSLIELDTALDNKLNFYRGNTKEIILSLIQTHQFDSVYWNSCYEPWRITTDSDIKATLKKIGIDCKSFNASLLWEPMEILKSDGTPYKVFTPFYRNGCLQAGPPRKLFLKPEKLDLIKDFKTMTTIEIKDLSLLYTQKWSTSLESHWIIGEKAAQIKLNMFLENHLRGYKNGRDFPAQDHVSRLSPHLHFGEISPHQVWSATQLTSLHDSISLGDSDHFLKE